MRKVMTMAKYTMELGTLVRMDFPIFDDTWCTFVPEHRQELCDKIIRHYYFYEIGQETPERFAYYLNEQLALKMPFYNKLYESELWKLYPLCNIVLDTNVHGFVKSSDINDAVSRRDRSALQQFGESLHHDLKDNEWTKFDQNVHGVENQTGNLTGNHDETEHTDRNYTKHQDNIMDETSQRDINEVTESKEVMDDDTTGHTTGSENRTTTGSHWSSDTPQGRVDTSGSLTIDNQYLTNYNHDSEQINRSYTEDTKGTDDRTTDFNKTVTTDDDLTRKVTEDNTETYNETIDRTKNNKDVEDTTGWKDQNTDTDATTHRTLDTLSHDFRQNTTGDNSTDVESTSKSGMSEQGTDSNTHTEGTSGVSRVQLLNDYRQSIINIDEIIINDLAVNFMGVF